MVREGTPLSLSLDVTMLLPFVALLQVTSILCCMYNCELQIGEDVIECSAEELDNCNGAGVLHTDYNSTSGIMLYETRFTSKQNWTLVRIPGEETCLNVTVESSEFTTKDRMDIQITRNLKLVSYSFSVFPARNSAQLNVNITGHGLLELNLYSAKCPIKCGGLPNVCNIQPVSYKKHQVNGNFNGRFNFKNLTSLLYYCIDMETPCYLSPTVTEFLNVMPQIPDSVNVPNEDFSFEHVAMVLGLMWGILLLVMAVALFLVRFRRRVTRERLWNIEACTQDVDNSWLQRPSQKVLLLYSRDVPQFHKVMQAFKTILKKFGNIQVLDPLDEHLSEHVRGNLGDWLTYYLNSESVKVVIVQTELAILRQRALFCRKTLKFIEPSPTDFVFTKALNQFHNNMTLSNNYERVFPIRFEDFSKEEERLTLITPLTCFLQLKHLEKLIIEIHGVAATTECTNLEDMYNSDEMNVLKREIQCMKKYYMENPNYIKTLLDNT